MSHYLKLICDMIFGENNFLSEIVWCYRERGISKTYWNNKHDIILFYVKKVGEHNFNCNVVLEPYSEEYLKKFKYEDEKGLYQIRGKNIQGSPVQKADGLTPKAEVLYPDLTYRQYMQDGMLPLDWWQIPLLNKSANERLGYPTQKPEALLERVIKASSNEGDIVADFFCGCGTTIAVAERLHRNWLGVDISHLAIKLIVNRLTKPYEEDEEKKRKWILENIEITGFPKDVASAKELARNTKDGRFGFQDWIVEIMLGGVLNPKRTADGGWDGYLTFEKEEGKKEVVLVEVKSGKVNVKNIREFIQVVEKQQASIGVFVCFEETVTKDMLHESKSQGYYAKEMFGNRYDKIQIISVEDLLNGKHIQMPESRVGVFKYATKKVMAMKVKEKQEKFL